MLGILETAFAVMQRIREAQDRQKDLGAVLQSHSAELDTTRLTVKAVKEEKALQTAAVAVQLQHIEGVSQKLVEHLQALESAGKRGKIRQLGHQLARGSGDEKTLSDIMAELIRSKQNLGLKIQVANVGLARTTQGIIEANTAMITEVNNRLEGIFGETWQLAVVQLLNDRYQGRAYGILFTIFRKPDQPDRYWSNSP